MPPKAIMATPTITRYAQSVAQPYGLFRTLDLPVCDLDVYGDPVVISGGNAGVFRVAINGKRYALKCYTTAKPRTAELCKYLSGLSSPLLYDTKFLPGEIFVYGDDGHTGSWFDVLLTEWAEGNTIEYEIARALH